MKNECSIVRDILPLHIEGMLSNETAAFVEEHLSSCPHCRNEMTDLKNSIAAEAAPAEQIAKEAVPLKAVKKKLLKRRIITALIAVVLTVSLIGVISSLFHSVYVDYGISEKYTREEMDAALDLIEEEFYSWKGCKLYSIHYTSDEYCESELDYVNTLAKDGVAYTDCIVFRMNFRSPLFGGGAWNANYEYNWSWYLARTQNGQWELLTWGV